MGLFVPPNQCNTLLLWYGRPVTNPVFLLNRINFARAFGDRCIYHIGILRYYVPKYLVTVFYKVQISLSVSILKHLDNSPGYLGLSFYGSTTKSHTRTYPCFWYLEGLRVDPPYMGNGRCRL